MSPNAAPRVALRRWKPVEENLRKLHGNGLSDPRLYDLKDLVEIAYKLSDKPTDAGCVEDAIAQGIDAIWGGAREKGPTMRDTMRLWFGLPAVDDSAAPNTRLIKSSVRHEVAWKYLHQVALAKGERPQEARSTFRTTKAYPRYEAIAKKLVELEKQADTKAEVVAQEPPETKAEDQPEADAPHLLSASSTTPDELPTDGPRPGTRSIADRLRLRRTLPVVALLATACVAVVAWAPWSSSQAVVPPDGAIVNAQTGGWSMHAPKTPAELPAEISGSYTNGIRGCDLTTEHPCHFDAVPKRPLDIHAGDELEFIANLYVLHSAIPYVKIGAGMDWLGKKGVLSKRMDVFVFANWSSVGEFDTGTPRLRETTEGSVYLETATEGQYNLRYIPGSTVLFYRNAHFFQRLPDGIYEGGIALRDLGPPPTACATCAMEYVRYVGFRTRVVREHT